MAQELTPLGQAVDKAVWDLAITVREHIDVDAIGHKKWNHCDVCLIARHRLENAIRARMEEYKAEGYPEPSPPEPSAHEHWCGAAEHQTCINRGYHVCRCGATRQFGSVGQDTWVAEWRTSEHIIISKQQKLSQTLRTLLGYDDPDRVAAWINRAHRIANEAAGL